MTDIVVIGGGMAGVAAAAFLSRYGSVILVEGERNLAYHTTGRSAALFVVNYGGEGARPLALASRPFLENPPGDHITVPLLSDRGLAWVGDETQAEILEEIEREGREAGAGSRLLDAYEVRELVPILRPGRFAVGLYEPSAMDIDVAGLHQVFVRMARACGAEIKTSSPVTALVRSGSRWMVTAGGNQIECDVVVNAAGAWGDRVAALAGIPPVGLQPMRRTAFMVDGDEAYALLPMVVEAAQSFYFKPDGVQFLCSLAEEIPSEPTDPRPRMEDVALAIDRINAATTLGIRSVNSQWTGLRTFAPDRAMVIGEEPDEPGFFWLVGQGGTGIQTAPAYGALLAALVTGEEIPPHLSAAGVDPVRVAPSRFRR